MLAGYYRVPSVYAGAPLQPLVAPLGGQLQRLHQHVRVRVGVRVRVRARARVRVRVRGRV